MRLYVATLLLIATSASAAEPPSRTVDCSAQTQQPGCTVEYENGGRRVMGTDGKVKVVVESWPGPTDRAYARIVAAGNVSAEAVDLDPANMTMRWTNGMMTPASDPDAMLDKYERHAHTLNFLGTILDQMATGDNNAVAVDSVPGHSVAYDTNMAQERGNERGSAISAKTGEYRTYALRRTTLHSKEKLAGVVFFEKPKCKDAKRVYPAVLTITVGGTKFVF